MQTQTPQDQNTCKPKHLCIRYKQPNQPQIHWDFTLQGLWSLLVAANTSTFRTYVR